MISLDRSPFGAGLYFVGCHERVSLSRFRRPGLPVEPGRSAAYKANVRSTEQCGSTSTGVTRGALCGRPIRNARRWSPENVRTRRVVTATSDLRQSDRYRAELETSPPPHSVPSAPLPHVSRPFDVSHASQATKSHDYPEATIPHFARGPPVRRCPPLASAEHRASWPDACRHHARARRRHGRFSGADSADARHRVGAVAIARRPQKAAAGDVALARSHPQVPDAAGKRPAPSPWRANWSSSSGPRHRLSKIQLGRADRRKLLHLGPGDVDILADEGRV
jgi:hypothetical protein